MSRQGKSWRTITPSFSRSVIRRPRSVAIRATAARGTVEGRSWQRNAEKKDRWAFDGTLGIEHGALDPSNPRKAQRSFFQERCNSTGRAHSKRADDQGRTVLGVIRG